MAITNRIPIALITIRIEIVRHTPWRASVLKAVEAHRTWICSRKVKRRFAITSLTGNGAVVGPIGVCVVAGSGDADAGDGVATVGVSGEIVGGASGVVGWTRG